MESAEFHHRFAGGQHALVRTWRPKGAAKAMLQVIHGMAEHSGRYDRFARRLAAAGYAVIAHDLPGHGPHADPGARGHFADRRGWRAALGSIRDVQRLAQREHPGLPLVMFGHSMGSLLLQHYVADSGGTLAGAIFSATTGDLGPQRRLGLALLRAEAALYGRRHPSTVAHLLTFRAFNRRFRPARTDFDWLSRDPAEVDRYVADPHCGFRCSTGLWIDLMEAAARFASPQRLRRIPKSLPVLMIAGGEDPVTSGAKGPNALARQYAQVGLRDVTVKVYPQARHEVFNELCRDEAVADLIAWLDARTAAPR